MSTRQQVWSEVPHDFYKFLRALNGSLCVMVHTGMYERIHMDVECSGH